MIKLTIVGFIGALLADVSKGFEYLSSLMYFIIAGKVPGTNMIVPAETMLSVWSSMFIMVILFGVYAQLQKHRTKRVSFKPNTV